MNKGRNIAILMVCLLVLSLLTLLTRTYDTNLTAVVDYVRYVRVTSEDAASVKYEFYFVGTEVMEGAVSEDDDGTIRVVISERIPIERPAGGASESPADSGELDYTLAPYGYTYLISGKSRKTAEVNWEYADGFDGSFSEQPFERFSKKVFVTMIYGQKPVLTVYQAIMVAAIAAGGALIIFNAEELWHFFNKKGEDEIPEWHDMDIYKRIGGGVIGLAAVLLIVFVIV